MACGERRIAAPFSPERSTLLHEPLSIPMPTNARQLPSFEFGNPPKLQPQPKSQLQNSKPRPLRVHRVVFAFVAMVPPPINLTNSIQITANIHSDRGGHPASHLAKSSWSDSRERTRYGSRNSVCFFFAIWYL